MGARPSPLSAVPSFFLPIHNSFPSGADDSSTPSSFFAHTLGNTYIHLLSWCGGSGIGHSTLVLSLQLYALCCMPLPFSTIHNFGGYCPPSTFPRRPFSHFIWAPIVHILWISRREVNDRIKFLLWLCHFRSLFFWPETIIELSFILCHFWIDVFSIFLAVVNSIWSNSKLGFIFFNHMFSHLLAIN
jgi:hypothetical protein